MADGQISRAERHMILADAKNILKPEEYDGFKRALNRLSPPNYTAAKHPTKVAQKKKSPTMAQHKGPGGTLRRFQRKSNIFGGDSCFRPTPG